MKKKIAMMLSMVVGVSLVTAGCVQTPQYAGFAQMGSTYAAAIDKLLVAAGDIKIDATSEQLLADKRLAPSTPEQYKKMTKVDLKRLEILGQLRAHVRLMGNYFSALSDLATSTAPDRAAASAAGAAKGLEGVGLKLSVDKAVSPLAKLVVSSVIRGALRTELETRQETIRTELALQEELINELGEILQQDLKVAAQKLENRLVIEPFVDSAPIRNPDEWVTNRRRVLHLSMVPGELKTAGAAVGKLREAFEDLVAGKMSVDRVNSLLTDFDAILSIAETIKSQAGGQ
jgi:uncharacterized coiled-coil protein SlyX/outer membrane murein-binding lipoprotein Lpp